MAGGVVGPARIRNAHCKCKVRLRVQLVDAVVDPKQLMLACWLECLAVDSVACKFYALRFPNCLLGVPYEKADLLAMHCMVPFKHSQLMVAFFWNEVQFNVPFVCPVLEGF